MNIDETSETNDSTFGEHDNVYTLTNIHHDYETLHGKPTKSQLKDVERIKPVQPKSQLNRNDLCLCGSGKKYKNCCLNKNI